MMIYHLFTVNLMLDHLRLAIPTFSTYAKELGNTQYFNGDLLDLGLPCATRHVSRDDDGNILTGDLYVPFESLPSSYTDMAFKFYTSGVNRLPYVEIKASPLKLLQGHNVYGFEDIELGALEMLGLFTEAYPKLCSILDFDNIDVLHLDTTYFTRLPHQHMVQPVLDYLANCQSGHRKSSGVKYANYISWMENSDYLNLKAYGKHIELIEQYKKVERRADKGCNRAKLLKKAMADVLDFSAGCVRFEARIRKTYLTKNGYPTNLYQLIDYQRKHPSLLQDLWHICFDPLLETLKGANMTIKNDYQLEEMLKSKLQTITPTGRISYSRAYGAMSLYRAIRDKGFNVVKDDPAMPKTTFYKHLKALNQAGISRGYLQNLHTDDTHNIVPFVRMIEIKFDQQLPDDYVKPVSRYADNSNNQPQLTLIA